MLEPTKKETIILDLDNTLISSHESPYYDKNSEDDKAELYFVEHDFEVGGYVVSLYF